MSLMPLGVTADGRIDFPLVFAGGFPDTPQTWWFLWEEKNCPAEIFASEIIGPQFAEASVSGKLILEHVKRKTLIFRKPYPAGQQHLPRNIGTRCFSSLWNSNMNGKSWWTCRSICRASSPTASDHHQGCVHKCKDTMFEITWSFHDFLSFKNGSERYWSRQWDFTSWQKS